MKISVKKFSIPRFLTAICLTMSAVAITTLFCSCSEGDKKDIQRTIEWQKNPQAAADKVGKEVTAIIKELVTPTTSSEERAQYFHPDIKDKVDFFPMLNKVKRIRAFPDKAIVTAEFSLFDPPVVDIHFKYSKGKWTIVKIKEAK